MATTVNSDLAPVVQYGTYFYQYGGVVPANIFVVTFSDGQQVAIAGYDDKEYSDLRFGVPQDNIVNFYMYYADGGGTFTIYSYDDTDLGAPIYSFTNINGIIPGCFRLSYNSSTNQLSVLYDSNGSSIDMATGEYTSFSGTQVLAPSPVCFLRGTRILTNRGLVAVEDLVHGDRVASRFGGLRPIKWIGTQRFDGRLIGADHHPVCVHANALGPDMPRQDLFISPGHSLVVDDLLVHASVLINDRTITQARIAGPIEYYHLDLGDHDCVLANGVWAESYFEDHNRDRFHNAATAPSCYDGTPQRQATCLPIVVEGDPRADRLHARFSPRLPKEALTHDPGVHLLADGHRIGVTQPSEHTWQVTIPAGVRHLRLRSRATRPSMVSDSGDRRPLGLMVWEIEIATAAGIRIVPPDHPWLSQGWHEVESDADATWRWTNGDALLPALLLGDGTGPAQIKLRAAHQAFHFVGSHTDPMSQVA